MDITVNQELAWEQDMVDNGVKRYENLIAKASLNSDSGHGLESNTSYGAGMIQSFVQKVATQIEADVQAGKRKPGRKPIAWEYLSCLDYQVTSLITCRTILDNISGEVTLTMLVSKLAQKVEDQARIDTLKDQDKKYYQATGKYIKDTRQTNDYQRKRKIYIHSADIRAGIREWVVWPAKDKIHIGTALLEAFIKGTSDYINGERVSGSGLVEKYSDISGKSMKYYVAGTSKAYEWIKANQDVCKFFKPEYIPCLIKPRDWSTPFNGGFHNPELRKQKPLVKMQQRKYLYDMAKRGVDKLYTFYNAVNTLQGTAWEINEFILDVASKEFAAPNGIHMPSQEPGLKPATPPWMLDRDSFDDPKEYTRQKKALKGGLTHDQKEEYMFWTVSYEKWKHAEYSRAAKCKSISDTLNMARKLQYKDEFYYVWTADFRSRLYACGTTLSPQGTDLDKSLLLFKRGVPLGKDGFKHLCIHAAGVFGNDKVSIDDRLNWVMQNEKEIINAGTHPDTNRDYWKHADKPYCFLAVCKELGECIQLSTKERESYISKIPCAQDGSCNGIQHYSAMLRDPLGASVVNLVDSLVPSDIYMECAAKTIEYIHKSINERIKFTGKEWVPARDYEIEIAQKWLEFGIARDCTKKPTMVIPYGGTKISCRTDIKTYLQDFTEKKQEIDPRYDNPFVGMFIPDLEIETKEGEVSLRVNTDPEVQAITWLHHLVWLSLDEVVVAARKAMKFLRDTAKAVVGFTDLGNPLIWTTRTGFRVYQEIKQTELFNVKTHLEGSIRLKLKKDIPEIDKRRMGTSVAPNFVHSLDSSHLQMTVSTCHDLGIEDFACIHDSFGTHAGHTTLLHKVLRREFVNLHQNSVLYTFWNEQAMQNIDCVPDLPSLDDVQPGEFDLEMIKSSTHFFR